MKRSNLQIEQLVETPSAVSGRFIITCRLLVDGAKKCWLAADFDSYQDKRRIELPDSGPILESLFRTQPVLGGGPVTFDEKLAAEIEIEDGRIIKVLSWELDFGQQPGYEAS